MYETGLNRGYRRSSRLWRRRRSARRGYAALAGTVAAAVITGWMATGPGANHSVSAGATPAVSADLNALLAQTVTVNAIPHVSGYERGCGVNKKTGLKEGCVFGPAWNDPTDHSGCDTRSRVLRAQLQDVTFKPGTRECKPISGWFIDPYTGQRITLQQTNIDHIYPLARAWDAGAWRWDLRQRQIFANDVSNLVAVSAAANQQKSDSGLDGWLPSDPHDRCNYARQYLSTAVKYKLEITSGDRAAALTACGGT